MFVSNPFVAGHWIVQQPHHLERDEDDVSNPFVAGHWIVHGVQDVANERVQRVSNPFVAGHWIVPTDRSVVIRVERDAFQTPS